jgi:phasin family protein
VSIKSQNNVVGAENPADAFRTISGLYLTSAQRLAELNMSAMREAVDKTTSAVQSKAGAKGVQDLQFGLFQPLIESAQTYVRNAYEIVAETQQEVMRVMLAQMSSVGTQFSVPTEWNSAFEAFNSGIRRFSALTNENVSAVRDAGTKALNPSTYEKKSA